LAARLSSNPTGDLLPLSPSRVTCPGLVEGPPHEKAQPKGWAYRWWLPERDAQQNFFRHSFRFWKIPLKKNNPRSEYSLKGIRVE